LVQPETGTKVAAQARTTRMRNDRNMVFSPGGGTRVDVDETSTLHATRRVAGFQRKSPASECDARPHDEQRGYQDPVGTLSTRLEVAPRAYDRCTTSPAERTEAPRASASEGAARSDPVVNP